MKTGRRQDPDGLRRIPRDRDLALSRTRKRPSMLSEFHGKHYNHRELDRDSGGPHHRPYYRCSQYELGSGMKRDRYGPGFFKGDSPDVRHFSSSPYARTLPPHGTQFYDDVPMEMNHSHEEEEEEAVPKRPRLLADVSSRARHHLDPPSSADSSTSGTVPLAIQVSGGATALPSSPPQGSGLSAYLEDIESDEGDLGEEEEKVKLPAEATPPSLPNQPSKEQLLQKMEKVDRDIAATEGQIAALQKKQAEVEESVRTTPSASSPSPFHPSPITPSPSPEVDREEEEEMSVPSTPGEERRVSPRRSLLDTVYSENRLKARSAQAVLSPLSHLPPSSVASPLYYQPWEAPGYFDIIQRHRHLRSELVHFVQKQRLEKHEKDLALCKQYDGHMAEWRRRLDKVEGSVKKKTRDQKNRELFERTFPELKMKREQQERLMRVDQRGYGVVRSELELNQLMYELYEQEEAPARTRRTHAVIPAMVTGGSEERVQFHNTNGLIKDPMAVYRAAKLANVWTDEEKKIFREKYAIYPKNFEAISSFLPCKTTADCVRYYYLSKKNEKFKQLARKASLKRRKFIKPGDLASLPPPPSGMMGEKVKMESPLLSDIVPLQAPPTALVRAEAEKDEPMSPKPSPKISRYGDWTDEDISNLRMGLRRWGRAWGKIYREVGGRKTATQCKQFYDDFCNDESLGLAQVLTERSSIKTAEKAQRKAESRKSVPIIVPAARKRVAKLKPLAEQEQVEDEEAPAEEGETPVEEGEGESEVNESASNFDSGSGEEDSGSESTITDSSPEDNVAPPPSSTHSSSRGARARKADGSSPSLLTQGSTENGAFDLFISAAEALNNTIPPEVALHDHNYALAPISSVELQGSSGLSLIAAAAAVVSPSLSRSAGSGKFPAMSPVRAPRGRPPNTQRRGSSSSTCKLAPTLLSPAGNSIYVPLTDTTKSSFRSRARSAPSDRPRIQLPRAGPSNLRYSISSKSSSPRPILPPASYSRLKETAASTSGGTNARSSSLKSMIASRPPQTVSSNAAFETLVNVAVAASPADVPKSTATAITPTATLSISFQNPSNSAPSTPVSASPHLSDGTYSIDMSQAINILALASLAQGSPSSSTSPSQPVLLTQGVGSQASSLLGTIVSQSSAVQDGGKPAAASTVNVLIGHLTSGSSSPTPSAAGTPLSDSSGSSKGSPVSHHELPPSKPQQRVAPLNTSLPPSSSAPSPSSPSHSSASSVPPLASSTGDDLSNLNLLSSLVAVVTGSQAPPTPPTPSTPPTSRTTESLIGYSVTSTSSTPSAPTTTVSARASAFKATNLPAVFTPSTDSSVPSEKREIGVRSKVHEKSTPQSSLHNSDHSRSTSSRSGLAGSTALLDNLPRSVVRSSSSLTHQHQSHTASNSLTTSLVPPAHPSLSSYPAPTPSISQQSTLLLYTRSLSLPNPSGAEVSSEEEDHLESATRGISELSKLLGTDSGTESLSSSSSSESSMSSSYRNSWDQNSVALPSPARTSRVVRGSSPAYSAKAELGNDSSKPYLSGLLESHSSHLQHSSSSPNNSNANNNCITDLTRNVSR